MNKTLAYLWGTDNDKRPSLAFIRFPMLVLLPAIIAVSALAALFYPAYAQTIIQTAVLVAVGLSIVRTAIALSLEWPKSPVEIETHPIHSQFKISFITYGFLAVLGFMALVLSLSFLLPTSNVLFPSVEIGLLAITIVFLALFARYNAMSFSVEIAQLQSESRESTKALGDNFIAATNQLTETYNKNTSDLIAKLDSQGERQANLLAGMADALQNIAKFQKAQLDLVADSKRLAEETLNNQKETDRERKELEQRREVAQQQVQELERLRMLPRLGVRLAVEGVIFHHVNVDIINIGMSSKSLEVTLDTSDGRSQVRLGGDLNSQQQKRFDFGDVARFPNSTQFTVRCSILDAVGRMYGFQSIFEYTRVVGWLGNTTSISVQPNDYVFSTPSPEYISNSLGFRPG